MAPLNLNFERGFFYHVNVNLSTKQNAEIAAFKELLNNWISGERFGIDTYEYVLKQPEFSFADLKEIQQLRDDEIRHWNQTEITTERILGYVPDYLYKNHIINWQLESESDVIHRCVFIAAGEFYSKAFMTAVKNLITDPEILQVFDTMISEEFHHQLVVKDLVRQAYQHFGLEHQKNFENSIDFYFTRFYNLHPQLLKRISEELFGFYDQIAVSKSFVNSVYNTIYFSEYMKLYDLIDIETNFLLKKEQLIK